MAMKVTVEVECTPEEARAFMGLPDVKPMQTAIMANLEQQAQRAVDSLSPETMVKQWFNAMPQVSNQIQEMFGRFLSSGGKG